MSVHDSFSNPVEFVARMVIVCGEPPVVGVGQLTTPVAGLIVIPAGPLTSDHPTGFMHVGLVSVGVGPVYAPPQACESFGIAVTTGAGTDAVKETFSRKNPSSIAVLKCETRMNTV